MGAFAVDRTISGFRRFLRSLGLQSGEYVTQDVYRAWVCCGAWVLGEVLLASPFLYKRSGKTHYVSGWCMSTDGTQGAIDQKTMIQKWLKSTFANKFYVLNGP